MSASKLPQDFLDRLGHVTGKRSRVVVDHILEHGFVTTDELEQIYGYMHPPRAVRDVREQGIPIDTYRVKSSDGRTIAAYRFGEPAEVREKQHRGRATLPRKFRTELFELQEGRCAICNGHFVARELQIDHKVPYEVVGDSDFEENDTSPYMLLCGSCNRAKSWSCENCPNWQEKEAAICEMCYWAEPVSYTHVALKEIRRADLIWAGDDEVNTFAQIASSSRRSQQSIPDYIKELLKNIFISVTRLFL